MKLFKLIQRLTNASLNSKTIILVIIFIVFVRNLDLHYWKSENRIINWDIISYYAYLPATFIYHDLTLEFLKNPKEDFSGKFWPKSSPVGKPVIMTSMGMSVLYAPFFFVAHWYTKLSDFKADGYSAPYRFFLIMSCVFYLALGLIFLRKLLIHFFRDYIISIVLIIITFGTNIWYYVTIEPTMAHAYNFSLIIIFTYLTYKWYSKSTIGLSVLLGIVAGLISLIRPTNIIIILIFLFWDVRNLNDMRSRLSLYIKKYYLILIILAAAFVIWIPQLFYWKMQTGQYFYYSYGNSERFFFGNPQIINTLFSYRKGWLLYTPVMIFAIAGLYFLWKKRRELFLAILLYFAVHLYVTSSWWCWWWGGSFGLRAMIDIYGILAIPLGYTLYAIFSLRKFIKIPLIIVISLLVLLSIFNTMQVKRSIIHWDSMTKKAYWAVFLRYRLPEGYYDMLEQPDYEKARKGIQAVKE
ncbi:MAG: hypothetical protein JW723_15555 [Bacteroidales bacterium]|nr:hypothetical protein [Bacteroidales bacterium]